MYIQILIHNVNNSNIDTIHYHLVPLTTFYTTQMKKRWKNIDKMYKKKNKLIKSIY